MINTTIEALQKLYDDACEYENKELKKKIRKQFIKRKLGKTCDDLGCIEKEIESHIASGGPATVTTRKCVYCGKENTYFTAW